MEGLDIRIDEFEGVGGLFEVKVVGLKLEGLEGLETSMLGLENEIEEDWEMGGLGEKGGEERNWAPDELNWELGAELLDENP